MIGGTALERPIGHTGHAQGTFLLFAGLRNVDPPDRQCLKSQAVHGLEHRLEQNRREGFVPTEKRPFARRTQQCDIPRTAASVVSMNSGVTDKQGRHTH